MAVAICRRVAVGLAVGAVAAASVAAQAPGSRTACAPAIVYRGVTYTPKAPRRHVRTGGRVRASVPGCNDTPGAREPSRPIVVFHAAGVSPRVALVSRSQLVYVASGLFPQVPSFPLHRALYGRTNLPQECRGLYPDVVLVVRGRVERTPLAFGFLRVRSSTGSRDVFVDSATELAYPVTRRLVGGTSVGVIARVCGSKLVARRIALR